MNRYKLVSESGVLYIEYRLTVSSPCCAPFRPYVAVRPSGLIEIDFERGGRSLDGYTLNNGLTGKPDDVSIRSSKGERNSQRGTERDN